MLACGEGAGRGTQLLSVTTIVAEQSTPPPPEVQVRTRLPRTPPFRRAGPLGSREPPP